MLIALTFLLPLCAAAALVFSGAAPTALRARARRSVVIAAPLTVAPAVALALTANIGTPEAPGAGTAPGGTSLEILWLLFGTHFAVDYSGRALLLIGALLYAAALMAVGWLKLRHAERSSAALTAFLLMSFIGNAGVYLAADTVSFYLSFAVMSFSAAGLVVHYRSPAAHRATSIYLVMSVLSETAVLAALMITVASGGMMLSDAPAAVSASDHTGLVVGLLLFGFGVKAGTIPLHVWLPLAHPAAPPAASAVLSGAMVKAGLVGWLRFVPSAEPLPAGDDAGLLATLGWVLLGLALTGAFAAVVAGVLQNDPKVVLAYSTISQMGFIAALVAVGMIESELRTATSVAAVIYAVHHGLAKGALFLGVPVLKHYGRGPVKLVVGAGLVIAALAVAGAPLTSGALGKYVSKEAVAGISFAGMEVEYLLPFVATGSTVLLMRFGWILRHSERDPVRTPDGELVSWLAVVVAAVVVPWLVERYWFTAEGLPVSPPGWEAATLWDASWPILLGLALGAAVWWLSARGSLPAAARADGGLVPPGDLIVAEESVVRVVRAHSGRVLDKSHYLTQRTARAWSSAWGWLSAVTRKSSSRLESRLTSWDSSGTALLLVLGLLVVSGALLSTASSWAGWW